MAQREKPLPPLTALDKALLDQATVGHELLGDWFLRPATREQWKKLPLELFPDAKLREIAKQANEGVEPDDLPLALSRNGARAVWPHPADAEIFLLSVPTRGKKFDELAAELRLLDERRKVLRELEMLGKQKPDDVATLDETLRRLELLRADAEIKPLPVMPVEDLFAELGEPPWVSQELAMQPGAPWMLSGHSGRGKSWILTDICIAIASGLTWGPFQVKPGKIRWLHLEGSSRDLKDRVQKLARGRNVTADHLRGTFFASSHPRFLFSDPKLEEQLIRECDGFTLAVVDTFAVAAAGMKENDAAIRAPLDMLSRVSERTGCCFAVIHHHRKDPADPKMKVDTEMAVRGSGAINNALSASWAVTKQKLPDDALFKSRLELGKTWYGARDPLLVTGAWSHHTAGAVDLIVNRDAKPTDDGTPDEPAPVDNEALDREILQTVAEYATRELTLTALQGVLGVSGGRRRMLLSERCQALRVKGHLRIDHGKRGTWLLSLAETPSDATEVPF